VDQQAIGDLEEEQMKSQKGYLTIRSNRKSARINYEDMLYIESLADYIKIHQDRGPEIVSKEKISHIEKELPVSFIRIHRSFIVNRSKITSYSREAVILGSIELPISRTYRKEVVQSLQHGTATITN
jgi:DNA-binding LytR/AlgR family response regulator